MNPPQPSAPGPRLLSVDLWRTLAIVQMVAFHFAYDLSYFGWVHLNLLGDPHWVLWRNAIVTQFLFVMGLSFAVQAPVKAGTVHWKRWRQTAACAVLVSAATYAMFGSRWIWFGVLHFAALMQLAMPKLPKQVTVLAGLGTLALAVGLNLTLPAFDTNALSWIGFAAHKPLTEDFVPLLPWAGVVMLGMASGRLWQNSAAGLTTRLRVAPATHTGWHKLAQPGRWPLSIYMLHQPVLFGLLALLDKLAR